MLLCEPETTAVLRENYHYRPKDFYGENRVKRYFGRGLQLRQREEIEIEKATLCFALPDGASENGPQRMQPEEKVFSFGRKKGHSGCFCRSRAVRSSSQWSGWRWVNTAPQRRS